MVKISIIMPVYNAAEYLQKSIESVSKQTLKDLELICVDDGSTDNSLDILRELKELYPFIKVIRQENHGSGKARNAGIENATGEYIAFLDADDLYLDENALDEMYNIAKKNDANVVCANLKFVELDWTVSDNPHYECGDYLKCEEYGTINPRDYGIPYAFYKNIFKKEYVDEYGIRFPDLVRGQDPIFMASALINTKELYTVPLDLYGYNHAIGGGVNVKINTYKKKFDYLQHFKDTADILEEGGFKETSDFYKIHLFRFLTFKENAHDPEIIDIFNDIFGIFNDSFDEDDFNYTRFIIPAKFYLINKYGSEEFFIKVNKDFLQINIYDTFAIDEKVIEDYFLVVYSNSFDDFKSNYAKYLSNNLKFMKEIKEFIVNKFIFNLSINQSPVVRQNAKTVISKYPIWKFYNLSKKEIKKCYELLTINI